MKYRPDLNSFLKESKPNNFKENSIKSLSNTHLGQLKYNLKLNIETKSVVVAEADNEHGKLDGKRAGSLNSFQLAKEEIEKAAAAAAATAAEEAEEEIKENVVVGRHSEPATTAAAVRVDDSKALDELVAQTSKFNIEKCLKELNESDSKTLQEKHKQHVNMFEKFRTSPMQLKKETSVESPIAEKQIKSPIAKEQQPATEVPKERERTLTQSEIESKILNDKIARECFQYEKQAIDLLGVFEVLLNKMNEIGVQNFDSEMIVKCQSRLKDRQVMSASKIGDKLKLFLRITPKTYETEAKNFLDECKRSESVYKSEIGDIETKIREQAKVIEAEKAAKIARHHKAIELFVKEMEGYETKFKELTNIYKALNQTIENIDKNRERFDENFYKIIENSLKVTEKVAAVDIKALIEDKAKVQSQSEAAFQNILQNFKNLYDNFSTNVRECENKLNEEMKKIAIAAAAAVTATQTPVMPPPTQPEAQHTATNVPLDSLKTTTTTAAAQTDFFKTNIMPHAVETYNQAVGLVKTAQAEFESVFSVPQFKNYKYELQNAINFPLNSLLEDETNADNKRNFHDKIKTILRLLNGETCVITSTLTVNPKKHPKAIEFCMDYLARKIVEKGEKTVCSRPETAFQYIQLAVVIMKQYPVFQKVLIAYFYDRCPYCVPYYKAKQANQTIEAYFESLGYKIDDNGKVEEDEYFFKRMAGILHLYFTLLVNPEYKNGIKEAWIWLSDVLNMKPRANITAHSLAIFFKCCGYQLHKVYGAQFQKIIQLCQKSYMPHLKSISDDSQNKAFLGRLELILSDYTRIGHFNEWRK